MKSFALFVFLGLSFTANGMDLYSASSLFDCLTKMGKWDFEKKECSPGRQWVELKDAEMINELKRPLKESEIKQAKTAMGMYKNHTIAVDRPVGVLIVGGSGAGKSYLTRNIANWFPWLVAHSFVKLDGDILRASHQGLQKIVKDKEFGYLNAWELVKPRFSKLKIEALQEIATNRQNVLIPTGISGRKYYDILASHGYEIYILGVFTSFDVCALRGLNRQEWTGKKYRGSLANWKIAVRDMFALAHEEYTYSSLIFDNDDFYNPKVMFSETTL